MQISLKKTEERDGFVYQQFQTQTLHSNLRELPFSIHKINPPKKPQQSTKSPMAVQDTAVAQHNPKFMLNCLFVSIIGPIRRENGDRDLLIFHLEEKDKVLTSISKNLVFRVLQVQ